MIAIFTYARIITKYRNDFKLALKLSIFLTVGGLLPSFIVLVYLFSLSIFNDFWQSYILMTLLYPKYLVAKITLFERLLIPFKLILYSRTSLYFGFIFLVILFSFIFIFWGKKSSIKNYYELIFFSISIKTNKKYLL